MNIYIIEKKEYDNFHYYDDIKTFYFSDLAKAKKKWDALYKKTKKELDNLIKKDIIDEDDITSENSSKNKILECEFDDNYIRLSFKTIKTND